MMGTSSNGSRSPAGESGSEVEVLAKPKRRRFSVAEKSRIVREADACEAGTVGAYLRREGIYSSQLYAWRRERDRGDLDPQTVTSRKRKRAEIQEDARRIRQLEVENRKLQRKIARFELFEEIRKKAAGLLNLEYKSPEFDDEND
jgi:transposase-like protein